jgi:membrane fusion protein (multidrug efflux system)
MTDPSSPASDPATEPSQPTVTKPQLPTLRLVVLVLAGILLALGFYCGLGYTIRTFTHESTDDAFLEAHIVAVAPRVAGQIQSIHVKANQWVKRGDLLVELDPRDFEVRLAQKRAAAASANASLDSARAGLAYVKAGHDTAEATYRQEQANAESARAKSLRAQADLQRDTALQPTGVISQQEFDSARADADAAAADLRSAEQKAAAAASQVAQVQAQIGLAVTLVSTAESKIQQARTDEQAASLEVSYTKISAPCDGWVTRKTVEPGDYVQVGQSLFALVPGDFHVIANFKETQLEHIRPGQPAKIRIDAYPNRGLRGRVDSIMAGSGARFSLLPPENAVGNYVKIVQRVPVKMVFDDPLDRAMSLGPGMSVVPEVCTSSFTVSPAVLWAGALVLAVLTTLGLARVISHLRD